MRGRLSDGLDESSFHLNINWFINRKINLVDYCKIKVSF